MRCLPATAKALRLRNGSVRTLAIFALLTCVVLGCGSAPRPNLFTIPAAAQGTTDLNELPLVVVADVTLPAYARDRRIAIGGEANQILRDQTNRWVSDPSEMIAEALAQRLRALGSNAWTRPLPDGLKPIYTIDAKFETLLQTAEGSSVIVGQLVLTGADGLLSSDPFTIREASSGASGYPEVLGEALNKLAQQAFQSLEQKTPG
ncbi:MAG: ABC-type transport auxiliary lipoprotein family protein [Pseudomonadota bacterium]